MDIFGPHCNAEVGRRKEEEEEEERGGSRIKRDFAQTQFSRITQVERRGGFC